jgi:hypothetical protein
MILKKFTMNKIKLHIYGKYMGDIKVIHDVLEESNEYNMTYQYIDIGKGSSPSEIDYLITSHNNPKNFKGKIIHVHHGMGWLPELRRKPASVLLAGFRKDNYYAFCKLGKVQKSWLEDIGFPSERILVIGMAASIDLLSPMKVGEREGFLYKKGLNPAKKTIIYAPTWEHGDKRAFFYLWWEDGREGERVERFCKFITCDLDMNLVVRFHERHRYSQDWIKKYHDIFDKYKVNAHYINQDPYNLPYFKFSDILVGDLSSVNVSFYVMDKPVIHIGTYPFKKKIQLRQGGMALADRAGYIIEDFQDLLDKLEDSVINPSKFSAERKRTVDKYIDYLGEDSRKAILSEFRRFLHNDKGRL